jgi:hypothetical protein
LVALLIWPGTGSRYAIPVEPAFNVLAGFAAERLWNRCRLIVQAAGSIATAGFFYQLVLVTVAVPILPHRFASSRITGEAITRAIREAPAPVYCLLPCEPTRVFYVGAPVATLV